MLQALHQKFEIAYKPVIFFIELQIDINLNKNRIEHVYTRRILQCFNYLNKTTTKPCIQYLQQK